MRVSEFVFDYVHLLYYKCYKINLSRDGSYTDSPDWINNKNATINPTNKKDNKYFQHAVTVTINHKQFKKDPKGIAKTTLFINKYNWEGIKFSSEKNG